MTRLPRRSPRNLYRPPVSGDRPLPLQGLFKVPPRGRIAALLASNQSAHRSVVLSPPRPPSQSQPSAQLEDNTPVTKAPLPKRSTRPLAKQSDQVTERPIADSLKAPVQAPSDNETAQQELFIRSTSPHSSQWLAVLAVLAGLLVIAIRLWQLAA